jgi:hypothetical protein
MTYQASKPPRSMTDSRERWLLDLLHVVHDDTSGFARPNKTWLIPAFNYQEEAF